MGAWEGRNDEDWSTFDPDLGMRGLILSPLEPVGVGERERERRERE